MPGSLSASHRGGGFERKLPRDPDEAAVAAAASLRCSRASICSAGTRPALSPLLRGRRWLADRRRSSPRRRSRRARGRASRGSSRAPAAARVCAPAGAPRGCVVIVADELHLHQPRDDDQRPGGESGEELDEALLGGGHRGSGGCRVSGVGRGRRWASSPSPWRAGRWARSRGDGALLDGAERREAIELQLQRLIASGD